MGVLGRFLRAGFWGVYVALFLWACYSLGVRVSWVNHHLTEYLLTVGVWSALSFNTGWRDHERSRG